jgi:hypothetical protein
MKLDCALVACNENTHYLDFWPVVKRAWWDIVGIPCIMIYVGETLPEHLKDDPAVRHFKPIEGWPTATQAQVIRLLYPALLGCEGAVVLSDMDIAPLQKEWFVEGFANARPDQFVSLRGIDEGNQQVYMCYVGARPQIWAEMFGITNEQSVRDRLTGLAQLFPADGAHGGKGWCTDQIILYQAVKHWQSQCPEKLCLIPWTAEIPRLDRSKPEEWLTWNHVTEAKLQGHYYVDFHMPPYVRFQDQIRQIFQHASS